MPPSPACPATVALVEDDTEVRDRFVHAIGANPRLQLRQACGTATAMQDWLDANRVDVLLVDLGLPDRPGLDVIRHARSVQPRCEVMVVSTFADAAHMLEAFAAGARGYLVKDGTQQELDHHVLDLQAGGSPMSPLIARQLLARWQAQTQTPAPPPARAPTLTNPPSPREHDVLRLVARGCNYQEAGACLGISTATVQAHVRSLYRKLDVHSKTEAVYEARLLGLLDET